MASLVRFYLGSKLEIVFLEAGDHVSEAATFLADLADDPRTKAIAARLIVWIQRLADRGRILDPEKLKKLKGKKVWEIRASSARLLGGYLTGGRFLLSHGFMKKGKSTPGAEIKKAEQNLAISKGIKEN